MNLCKLDHVYVCVEEMERSIGFYEELLGQKVRNRSEDRWADFEQDGIYLGLIRPGYDGRTYKKGDNVVVVLRTDNIFAEYDRLRKFAPTISKQVEKIGDAYFFFHVGDPDGNVIEIAQYPR